MFAVGIPREIKPNEKRVGLTPAGVRALSTEGIPVFVESGAGIGAGFSDKAYETAGAQMKKRPVEIYGAAQIIKKVKEPQPSEWGFLNENHILFGFLHLASPENRKLLDVLLRRKIAGLGYETAEKGGRTIFLEPMSEIAGMLAGALAGFFLSFLKKEKGRIVYPARFLEKLEWIGSQLPEVPENLPPGKVAIFGGGIVGTKAAQMALQMGGEVDLIEKRSERRAELEEIFKGFKSKFRVWSLEDDFRPSLEQADVWIGAVHVVGKRAPIVVSREGLERLSKEKKKLMMDIAVDQGGNFPETHATAYEDPLYLDSFGNWRFAVANVPSLCARQASEAIERVTLPYLMELARDWKKALRQFPELRTALQVLGGKLVHPAVAEAQGLRGEEIQI